MGGRQQMLSSDLPRTHLYFKSDVYKCHTLYLMPIQVWKFFSSYPFGSTYCLLCGNNVAPLSYNEYYFKANISYQRKAWDFFDQIVVCGGKLSGLYPHQISSYFSQGNKIQTARGQYGPNLGELICNYLDILQPQLLSQSYVSYECWCEECRHHYLEHDVSKLHRRECLGKDDGKSRDCSSLKTFQRAVLFHQL